MRYTDEHHVAGEPDDVWQALHDPEVLSASIPGCERLIPLGDQEYVAILTVRTDTYRGLLTVTDTAPGSTADRGAGRARTPSHARGRARRPDRGRTRIGNDLASPTTPASTSVVRPAPRIT